MVGLVLFSAEFNSEGEPGEPEVRPCGAQFIRQRGRLWFSPRRDMADLGTKAQIINNRIEVCLIDNAGFLINYMGFKH